MKAASLTIVCLAVVGCATHTPTSLTLSGETMLIQGQMSEATALEFRQAWHGNTGHMLHLHAMGIKPLNAQDMARFGLTGVQVRPGYEKTEVWAFNANGVSNLQYIPVNWATLTRPAAVP